MRLAVLVEDVDANPTVMLSTSPFQIAEADGALDGLKAAVDSFNARKVFGRAKGALVWNEEISGQEFEYFHDECVLRKLNYPATHQFNRFHTCPTERQYWCYGKVVSWVPGKRAYWEVRVFHHDKKFVRDDVFHSKDILKILSAELPGMEMSFRTLIAFAEQAFISQIDEWDSAL